MSQTETNKTIAEIPERNRLITGTTIPKLIKYKVLKYIINYDIIDFPTSK